MNTNTPYSFSNERLSEIKRELFNLRKVDDLSFIETEKMGIYMKSICQDLIEPSLLLTLFKSNGNLLKHMLELDTENQLKNYLLGNPAAIYSIALESEQNFELVKQYFYENLAETFKTSLDVDEKNLTYLNKGNFW